MTVSRKRVKGVEGKGSGMQAYQLQSIKPINRALIVHFVHIILHKSEVWSTQARLPVDIVAAEAASRSDRFCFSSSSSSSFFFCEVLFWRGKQVHSSPKQEANFWTYVKI